MDPTIFYERGAEKPDDNIYALLSKEANKPKESRQKQVNTYLYNEALSTITVAVYVSPSTKKIIIVFGVHFDTHLYNKDTSGFIKNNHLEKSPLFQRSYQETKDVIKAYPDYIIQSTGCHTGGSVALAISRRLPLKDSKVVVFNPLLSHLFLAETIRLKAMFEVAERLRNQTIYTNKEIDLSLLGVKVVRLNKYCKW
jgi:hypothetical protein